MPLRPRTPRHDLVDRLIKVATFAFVTFCVVWSLIFAFARSWGTSVVATLGPWVLLPYFLLWLCVFALQIARNRMRGDIFRADPPREMRFRECKASGRSFRTLFMRLGGACNCLEVTVTDTELWTRVVLPWPGGLTFNGSRNGLENRIPLECITSVTRTGWWKKRHLIEYRDSQGRTQRLELRVRDMESFERALQSGNPALTLAGE